MKKYIPIIILFFTTTFAKAQCPTVSCPGTLTLTSCHSGQTVAAVSNYSSNITSRWIGPGNIPLSSSGTATSLVNLNHAGTYTVEFKDNLSNCVVSHTIFVDDITGKPDFNLGVSSYSMLCTSSHLTISIINGVSWPIPGAPVSYTLCGPFSTSVLPSGTLSSHSIYTISSCGTWVAHTRDVCTSSFSFVIPCSTLTPTPIAINGSNTVCLGSSVTYTGSGTNLVWSTSAQGPTMNIIPSGNTSYSIFGNDLNGCPSSGSVAVAVNPNCSQVWPGDANSDGIVDNTDVLEIGLAINSTGSARTPGGNVYLSQYATNWVGTVSSGKNRCHADCNGDGIVSNADNVAITNNFLLTHTFKTESSEALNPQISIHANPVANAGLWNKADIFLGDSNTSISQLYGIAFDLNYDHSLIENDSVYVVYTPSFLNTNDQNIEFGKTIFSTGKFYGASVRTDGNNVSGSSKIAEVYFKVKFGLAENSVLNLSVSNVKKIDNNGTSSTLSTGSFSMLIDGNAVGLSEKSGINNAIALFPNPASNFITFYTNSEQAVNYSIYDIYGKRQAIGEFERSTKLNIFDFSSGTYIVCFENASGSCYKKFLVVK